MAYLLHPPLEWLTPARFHAGRACRDLDAAEGSRTNRMVGHYSKAGRMVPLLMTSPSAGVPSTMKTGLSNSFCAKEITPFGQLADAFWVRL